ncbi:MAG: type II CAAX endopeptidase family protein [Jatrophihabitantaceae bacterium]
MRRLLPGLLRPALVDKAPRDHREPDGAFRRRRLVVALVLVAGALMLGLSLSVRPADPAFYPLTAGLAAIWLIGGLGSGPLHLGRISFRGELRRPVLTPVLIGLAAAAVFVAGALVVREIDPLRAFTEDVLDHARYGSLPLVAAVTLLNGVAEEIFFRGALFAALGGWHPVLASTGIYALVTVATGNPMLVFAAAALGLILGLQRRASGGILAPMLTHVTWSLAMLLALPPLFAR